MGPSAWSSSTAMVSGINFGLTWQLAPLSLTSTWPLPTQSVAMPLHATTKFAFSSKMSSGKSLEDYAVRGGGGSEFYRSRPSLHVLSRWFDYKLQVMQTGRKFMEKFLRSTWANTIPKNLAWNWGRLRGNSIVLHKKCQLRKSDTLWNCSADEELAFQHDDLAFDRTVSRWWVAIPNGNVMVDHMGIRQGLAV